METTFENARVNDRVYNMLFRCINPEDKTNAVIVDIMEDAQGYLIKIKSDVSGAINTFTKEGWFYNNGAQVLFWSKPEFVIPVRPIKITELEKCIDELWERKVKREKKVDKS